MTEASNPALDPIFAAIERNRAAMAAYDALTDASSDAECNAVGDVERCAFMEMVGTVPTSLAGAAALAGYIVDYPGIEYFCVTDDPLQALKSLAAGLKALSGPGVDAAATS